MNYSLIISNSTNPSKYVSGCNKFQSYPWESEFSQSYGIDDTFYRFISIVDVYNQR